MKFARHFTAVSTDPYADMTFAERTSEIRGSNGQVLRSLVVMAPESWSQTAVDILADKYLRRAGVPDKTTKVWEDGVPEWLQRRIPASDATFGSEIHFARVYKRIAGCYTYWGWKEGYFDSEEDAQVFFDEIRYMLAHQVSSPNSPVYFNAGLWWLYGIESPASGLYHLVKEDQLHGPPEYSAYKAENAYEHPLCHACFLNSIRDDLLGEEGIMDLWTRESRIFKFGAGAGSNFSALRGKGEPLTGGGKSSGLMSFLGTGNSNAGAIKSGGVTRRAAKMVIVDIDHPDIEDFINWKRQEEAKVAAMVTGSVLIRKCVLAIEEAVKAGDETALLQAKQNGRRRGIPRVVLDRAEAMARLGLSDLPDLITSDFEGLAYGTVGGQNSNNSVRVTDAFMNAVEQGGLQPLYWRTELVKARAEGRQPKPHREVAAVNLWQQIVVAAHSCADPGLHFKDTVNAWHTCPADGEIRTSNPCGEYLFLDDTACNLFALNLIKFLKWSGRNPSFDVAAFKHAANLCTVALDITITMGSYPSKAIAEKSALYRTIGLGYANLGSLLMQWGLPYDSQEGRALAGSITALMHFQAAQTSAELARTIGTFPRYEANKEHVLRVLHNHAAAIPLEGCAFHGLNIEPQPLDLHLVADDMTEAVKNSASSALDAAVRYGLRNAQLTLLQPTGTVALIMDCDTTGIEPDFALVKWKKLAGGGYMKLVNSSVLPSLCALGYGAIQISEIERYILGHDTLDRYEWLPLLLKQHGIPVPTMEQMHSVMDVRDLMSGYDKLEISPQTWDEINRHVNGTMTIEGAPHLKNKHLAVFDCANRCGKYGTRCISWRGHIDMMAAAQPFLSGAISKTINLPEDATLQDIADAYRYAWQRMIKDVALYRDNSKLSQALNTTSDLEDETLGQISDPEPRQQPSVVERVIYQHVVKRHALPSRRQGPTQKFKIGGQSVFLRAGEYEDGSLGEIFLDLHKQGSGMQAMASCFAIAVSLGLQHGVPLEEYVDAFLHTKFDPAGLVTEHPQIKVTTSILDAVFRDLAINYLGRTELANAPPEIAPQIALEGLPAGGEGGSVDLPQDEPPRLLGPTDAVSVARGVRLEARRRDARLKGYLGDPCPICHNFTLVKTGACSRCDTCGSSTGC